MSTNLSNMEGQVEIRCQTCRLEKNNRAYFY